jgi:Fe-S-cluster containining protein
VGAAAAFPFALLTEQEPAVAGTIGLDPHAGDATEVFVRDGGLRRTVKALARGVFYLNLWTDRGLRRARGERPYLLGGSCQRCAACCEAPGIRVHPLVWLQPTLRRAFLWWQERVNGFVLVEARRAQRVFVFRCSHFDGATRSCDSYSSRPGMCRDYPRLLLYQSSPQFHPACGYRPLARNAAHLLRVLKDEPLTDDQRARLARGLHLQ